LNASSRSYLSIVRANVFTLFNLILSAFGALTLVFGDWRDALFLGIVVANSGIGIVQEVRAKRSLDRLAVLVAPTAKVLRDGRAERLAVEDVALGDVLELGAGDQIVADGILERTSGLLVDESILTGESEPVKRAAGEEVRSGGLRRGGRGDDEGDGGRRRELRAAPGRRGAPIPAPALAARTRHQLAAPGDDRCGRGPRWRARVLAAAARSLDARGGRHGNRGRRKPDPGGADAPDQPRVGGRCRADGQSGALAQQLNAIESLASADVICLDKTGTLTESRLRAVGVVPREGIREQRAVDAVGRYAASASARNRTLDAIAGRIRARPSAPSPTCRSRRGGAGARCR
jgi:cation-transporting ATPase E